MIPVHAVLAVNKDILAVNQGLGNEPHAVLQPLQPALCLLNGEHLAGTVLQAVDDQVNLLVGLELLETREVTGGPEEAANPAAGSDDHAGPWVAPRHGHTRDTKDAGDTRDLKKAADNSAHGRWLAGSWLMAAGRLLAAGWVVAGWLAGYFYV